MLTFISIKKIQMNNLQIHYFSGTGNSATVARWMEEEALAGNWNCTVTHIGKIDRLNPAKPDPSATLAFISPVHGFNYPPVMINYLLRFPKGKNRVWLLNTRAGMRLGKMITPGLSGITFYFAAIVLLLKGYRIRAMLPVDLPSNWISVHPGLREKSIVFLHERNHKRVKNFCQQVYSGKSCFRATREVLQDLLLAPVAVLYYVTGRFVFAKTYYASADCNQCGICIKGCPVQAIIMVDQRPYWTFNCESCMKCMSNCPLKAIETAHGFIVALSIFYLAGVLTLFYSVVPKDLYGFANPLLTFVVETGIFLAMLAVFYRLMHYAMRIRAIERIVVYTSLTKYRFWGRRYKSVKRF